MKLLKFYYKTIYSSEAEKMIDKVRMAVYDLYSEYITNSTSFESSMGFVDANHDASSPIIKEDEYPEFDTWYEASRYSSTCAQKSELELYLEEPLVPQSKDLNVLQWWQFTPKYPTLVKLAHDLLAIHVSTVASESIFSTGWRVLDPNRNCLAPETIEALICAHDWLQTAKITSKYQI